jgi:uncharacterized membrane-anchored protein
MNVRTSGRLTCLVVVFFTLCVLGTAGAQEQTSTQPTYAWQKGPLDAKLGDQATLKLPEGYGFLGPQDAQRLLTDIGNIPSGEELGLVAGGSKEENWFVIIRYVNAGFVRDDDAANWDADEMLASIKEGTEEANAMRRERGFDTLTIRGWEEKPHYDKTSNKVVWAISADDREGTVVNYNTLALGRHGYISMNLVTNLNQLSAAKPQAALLLSNLNFVSGKRYADFDSATDKVAAVGLAALVAGAAFKSGLLAKLLVLLVAFKKVILIAGAAIVAGVWKLVKSRSSSHTAAPAA